MVVYDITLQLLWGKVVRCDHLQCRKHHTLCTVSQLFFFLLTCFWPWNWEKHSDLINHIILAQQWVNSRSELLLGLPCDMWAGKLYRKHLTQHSGGSLPHWLWIDSTLMKQSFKTPTESSTHVVVLASTGRMCCRVLKDSKTVSLQLFQYGMEERKRGKKKWKLQMSTGISIFIYFEG